MNKKATPMTRIAAALMIALTAASFVHADIPSADPKQRSEQYAFRTLAAVIRNITELDAIVVADGPDKEKLVARKTQLQDLIQKQINDLNVETRHSFETQAAAQEASLNTQIQDAKDPAVKDDLQKKVKPYQSLRARFLQAMIEGCETLASNESEGKTRLIMSGLALGLAFAVGGLMYARR